MPPAPYSLEKRLPSGEVAKCIGELATQEAPEAPGGSGGSQEAPEVQKSHSGWRCGLEVW